jgi:predicted phosphoadenosine phosphosulfate sulfurtransferase
MSGRQTIGINVWDAALNRLCEQYELGHRLVLSLSGGKDSTVVLELCILAATLTNRLPVEAVTRDEEILYPGTYEYLDRVWHRDDVDLHHLVAHQPIINAFNREAPYWWVFDPEVPADQWVRQPPPYAETIPEIDIRSMTTKQRFPVDEAAGQHLVSVQGLRVQESRGRMYGLFSSGGYMTKPLPETGVYGCRPVYDWSDADVWRAILTNSWDYSRAYDVMHRYNVPRHRLRIGPPSMNSASISHLSWASQAWPQWWDAVCNRLPGMRSAAKFGKRVLEPRRNVGESWQTTFNRECVEKAPAWIAERATQAATMILQRHRRHSVTPLPENDPCRTCEGNLGSWKGLAKATYLGDPFSIKLHTMPYIDPCYFRKDAGTWSGPPSF